MECDPFALFLSCLSLRFSLVLLLGALTSFFGDLSPIMIDLRQDGH